MVNQPVRSGNLFLTAVSSIRLPDLTAGKGGWGLLLRGCGWAMAAVDYGLLRFATGILFRWVLALGFRPRLESVRSRSAARSHSESEWADCGGPILNVRSEVFGFRLARSDR